MSSTISLGSRLRRSSGNESNTAPSPAAHLAVICATTGRRALGDLSDAEIFDQICPIVACPPRRSLTSFTLHAPLEAMARYGLMHLVHPSDRELARLQMLASAAVYGHQVDLMLAPARMYLFSDANAAAGELASTFSG